MSGFDLPTYLDSLSEQSFDEYVAALEAEKRYGEPYRRLRAASLLRQIDEYVEQTLR